MLTWGNPLLFIKNGPLHCDHRSHEWAGFKGNGRLGDGDNSAGSRWEPRVLSNLPTIVDVWCGKGITLLLDEFGRLHSFGVDTQYPSLFIIIILFILTD